ncbi:unnamed protein product [Pleuronectes platessa]|uniref:Uncharacterized protein n=1 Tax=Pleuronectes platessa TaxID=8262 RepID=A0A9N7V858_PLEPL|nr:unnamed protein product [Pleuronectes platessa]
MELNLQLHPSCSETRAFGLNGGGVGSAGGIEGFQSGIIEDSEEDQPASFHIFPSDVAVIRPDSSGPRPQEVVLPSAPTASSCSRALISDLSLLESHTRHSPASRGGACEEGSTPDSTRGQICVEETSCSSWNCPSPPHTLGRALRTECQQRRSRYRSSKVPPTTERRVERGGGCEKEKGRVATRGESKEEGKERQRKGTRRKGKLSGKHKEPEVELAHEAGWPRRIKGTVAGHRRSRSATVPPVTRSLARFPPDDL